MSEDHNGNGVDPEPVLELETVTVAPRLRITQIPAPRLPEEATMRDVERAIATLTIALNHNAKATVEEIADVRAEMRLLTKAVVDGFEQMRSAREAADLKLRQHVDDQFAELRSLILRSSSSIPPKPSP